MRATNRRIAGLSSSPRSLSPPSEWAFLTGAPYPDGPVPAGEQGAMSLPPFGRGVALLANAVAGTDWRAMRWDADAGVALRIARQPPVLTDPLGESGDTPWHYRWAAVEDLILYGNHVALYGDPDLGGTNRPKWLAPVPANDVQIGWNTNTRQGVYVLGAGTVSTIDAGATYVVDPSPSGLPPKVFTPDEVLHVSAGNRSGEPLGRGVLGQYGEWLGGALAAETHSGAYFAGAALPPAVLQSPTVLTQGQADDLKSKWRAMTSDREPVILPSGYVLTPIVSNAEQSQLVESRQWNATSVAMMLGIPTYKLGLAGPSMTYQNIESADIEFVRDSVDRYGRPLSEAFSKWLMPGGTSVAWDYAGRMRADATTTTTVVTGLVGSGVLTIDEARAMLGRPPLEQSVEEDQTPAGVPELTPSEVPQ